MNAPRPSLREQLLDVIHFAECANHGTTPDALINAFRDGCLDGAADMLVHSNPRTSPDFTAGVEWAVGMLRMLAVPAAAANEGV